ncbi:GRAM domain-containing protein 2B isoform X1 [Synchiropus splendidus]|uniref:GRAM domain-containing protein 2B isoform X1 n=2 Tax=Synchiropus splendidus TaxID=270530 RepID=UPI00237D9BE0|nr:GRAM domain-containing protein 2B isoform X1 [Synchiropus splendidus]
MMELSETRTEDIRRRAAGRTEDGDHLSDVEIMTEEHRVEPEHQDPSSRRKPVLVRSRTFDHSLLTQVQPDPDSKIERKKSHYSQLSKSNCQYHKIFKEISKEEQLRQSYTCALQKDILYQGRMFVSDHWICFHSKVFGKDTKIAIPVMAVTHVKKTKTAILLPNALVIATVNDRYVFVSFLSRDNTYKFLMSVCLHLEEKSPCNSPVPSSAEHSFRGQRSPHSPRFPRNFTGDFCDLDGAVRQRRQEMEESSSSDSQTPDYEKIAGITGSQDVGRQSHVSARSLCDHAPAEYPVAPFLEGLKRKEAPASPDRHHKVTKQPNLQHQDPKLPDKKTSGSEVNSKRTPKPFALSTLLLVYLFLVCVLVLSSCYLAVKIAALEQRLTTLGSMAESSQHEADVFRGSDVNVNLFSELLTLNLMKLEKVQKNLQRMLDEAA